jgi:hypothetical protein
VNFSDMALLGGIRYDRRIPIGHRDINALFIVSRKPGVAQLKLRI